MGPGQDKRVTPRPGQELMLTSNPSDAETDESGERLDVSICDADTQHVSRVGQCTVDMTETRDPRRTVLGAVGKTRDTGGTGHRARGAYRLVTHSQHDFHGWGGGNI